MTQVSQKPPVINRLFILVSRIGMKTRNAVIINYSLKSYNVDWEENSKSIALKYGSTVKTNPAKSILQKND